MKSPNKPTTQTEAQSQIQAMSEALENTTATAAPCCLSIGSPAWLLPVAANSHPLHVLQQQAESGRSSLPPALAAQPGGNVRRETGEAIFKKVSPGNGQTTNSEGQPYHFDLISPFSSVPSILAPGWQGASTLTSAGQPPGRPGREPEVLLKCKTKSSLLHFVFSIMEEVLWMPINVLKR